MTAERFLPVLPEFVRRRVDDDLVVGRLERDVFPVGMRGGSDQGVHVRFRDEFDGNGDVVLPDTDGFVVGRRNKTTVVVHKGDRVDGSQMVVVVLRALPGACVELNNLLVGHTSQKLVRMLRIGVEADNVRYLARRESADALAVLRVPKLDVPIEGRCEEGFPRGIERSICDGL